jgi:hypothetical protein
LNKANKEVEVNYRLSGPIDGAIACKYRNGYLYHVGFCYKGEVYHVRKSRTGVKVDGVESFSKNAEVRFYAHKSL